MSIVARYLYPVRVAALLVLASIVLYLFFNIWPIVYSIYIAFTNANYNNIIPPPIIAELEREREEVYQLLNKKSEIQSHLKYIDKVAEEILVNVESYASYINKSASEIDPVKILNYLNEMYRLRNELSRAITAPGYYLHRFPGLRDNAEKAMTFIGNLVLEVNRTISDPFFGTMKPVLSELDLRSIRSISNGLIPYIASHLNAVREAVEYVTKDYEGFINDVLRYINSEIEKYTLQFVGLENFYRLFSEAQYPYAIYKTILFIATSVPLKVVVGVGLAFFFSTPLVVGKKILRALLVLPWSLPALLTVTTWRTLFIPGRGPFALLFSTILGRGFNIYMLEWDAFIVYNIVEMWLAYPFIMTVTMGAISSIPKELIEATYIDGASIWQRFRKITFPLTARTIFFAAIMTTGASLQAFLVPLLINTGGPPGIISFPGTTPVLGNYNEFIILYGYRQAYFYREYGLAAASYIVATLILLIYALAWYFLLYKRGR